MSAGHHNTSVGKLTHELVRRLLWLLARDLVDRTAMWREATAIAWAIGTALDQHPNMTEPYVSTARNALVLFEQRSLVRREKREGSEA